MKYILLLTLALTLTACLESQTKNNQEGFYDNGPTRTQKLTPSGYTLNWSESYNEVIEVLEPYELKAQFTTQKALTNVEVAWVIPEGTEVLKGLATETFTSLKAGESIDLSIMLQSKEDKNQQIILIVGSKASALPFTLSKQINTHIPDLNR